MRILLINSWERDCGKKSFLSPPMGLWRMEAYVRAKTTTSSIDVFDPNLYDDPHLELGRKLTEEKYDIIGFSPLYLTLENDLSLMFFSAKRSPDSLFIAGGQEATFNHKFLFDNFSALDLIVAGEGEKPLIELLEVLDTKTVSEIRSDNAHVKSVTGVFLRGATNMTRPNPPLSPEEFKEATMLTDYSRIPQKQYWDLICSYYTDEELKDEELQKKIFVLKPFTSSYCPFNCTFCSSTNFQKFAKGGPAKVASLNASEMDLYLRRILANQPRTRTILFKDDNFFDRSSTDMDEMINTFLGLIKDHPHIAFAAKSRIDAFLKRSELLPKLKEANFFFISYGVESFSQKELDYMNKRVSPEDNKKVLRATNKAGIRSIIYVILSTPLTRVEDIFQTVDACIEFITEDNVVKLCPYIIPIKGSVVGDDPESQVLTTYQQRKIPLTSRSVEIAKMITPRDQDARAVLTEFESIYPLKEKSYKEKFGVVHATAEVSTLMKFLTLYSIALNKGFLEEERCKSMMSNIYDMLCSVCGKDLIDRPTDF